MGSVCCPSFLSDLVEEACPAGLHHSGFSCGNHQPKIFFEIPNVLAAYCCLHQMKMKAAASCRNVWYFKENLWLVISAREP